MQAPNRSRSMHVRLDGSKIQPSTFGTTSNWNQSMAWHLPPARAIGARFLNSFYKTNLILASDRNCRVECARGTHYIYYYNISYFYWLLVKIIIVSTNYQNYHIQPIFTKSYYTLPENPSFTIFINDWKYCRMTSWCLTGDTRKIFVSNITVDESHSARVLI